MQEKPEKPYTLIVCAILLAIIYTATALIINNNLKLNKYGRETLARVEGVKSRHKAKDGSFTYYHNISFDGKYGVIGLEDSLPYGSLIQITYLPDDPEVIGIGSLSNKPTSEAYLSKSALMGYFCCAVISVVTIVNLFSYRNRRI